MKRFISAIFALGLLLVSDVAAQLPNLDRTCHNCDRRYLDSLNVYARRSIRINQAGFRPQDMKYAYVADKPVGTAFSIIDASTGKEAYNGVTELVTEKGPKPGVWVNGVFKSIGTKLYVFGDSTAPTGTELLTKAIFSSLTTQGEYYVKIGTDTSAHFNIHPGVFNAIFETALKFLGAQRCGNTDSWFHGPCHLKDGSEVGHDLSGGWHDCGDHFKVSETMTYTAYGLITTYLVHSDRAEDRYGKSYDDTVFTDGIPDILYEAKIGADFFYKLYKASKADGLIAKHDMYHSVGVGSEDHQFWDVPEKQDAMPFSKGGPDRHVAKGVGTSSGMIAAVLAYFAMGWEVYDPVYSDSLLEAAKDIYANVVKYNTKSISKGTNYVGTDELKGFYPGGSSEANWMDDAAAGALALWYATKDTLYQYDLYKNMDINDNSTNYMYNNEPDDAGPYFKAGILGHGSGFSPGGWMLDFENVHSLVLYSFARLILEDKEVAASYNVGELERDSLMQRTVNLLRRLTDDGTQGTTIATNRFGNISVVKPYNLVWTSSAWGFNRYNMGAINQFFMLSELTKGEEKQMYLNTALDNIYYNLGANPWDVSFIMGVGDKNLNHPHNRAANPDGYNATSVPYKYRTPLGAFMGGAAPETLLKDDWEDYTVTETCADFTTTLFMPMLIFSNTLPVDKEGPLFSNIAGTPITDTEAVVSWDANEVALVTVIYNTTPDLAGAKEVRQTTASKGGSVTLEGLTPNQTYYFYLEGIDTKKNPSKDDNHGMWYQFTMTPTQTTISGVTICQVDHRSAKIYWWSSDRLNGVVNYGKTSGGAYTQSTPAQGGAVLFHEAELTNLDAGTDYYFSVSSGASKSEEYHFKTEAFATYADLDIHVKPSSYQQPCSNWEECHQFIIYLANNDTVNFQDFDIRVYLGKNNPFQVMGWTPITQNGKGDGNFTSLKEISFDPIAMEGDQYYLPIHIKDTLHVSGQMLFQLNFTSGTYKDLANGWSFVAHNAPTDPEQFNGIDLTKGPVYGGSETDMVEDPDKDGVGELAITRDPYITVYYHGKHVYGYGPDYTPENGPQTIKKVSLNFTSPFVTPKYSIEKVEPETSYQGGSRVTPTGILDDLEMNSISVFDQTIYDPATRKDSLVFGINTISSYGNNYVEWVSWHNHAANLNGSYDCACAVVRSNVEIDSITTPPEQRYLAFDVDTVTAYTGKMAEVHVRLLDSTLLPLALDVSILMTTETGYATFYTSSESTTPVERIDLIKGEAVFYVKSDTPTETIMRASGNTTSLVAYETASAFLIVKDLPPWPIIDVAKMVDTDCDNIPDAMDLILSNEYMAAEKQSFNSIKFAYGTDTLTSSKIRTQDGKHLVIDVDLPKKEINTAPTGSITLYSNVSGRVEAADDFYLDGIAPVLTSISVLERDTATTDKVYLQFSEEIKTPSPEWPIKLMPTNNPISIKNITLYNDSLNVWEFEIGLGTNGESLVKEGMKAQLLPTATIRDVSGNGINECPKDTLTVLLKIRPIPITYASISDVDQDGRAELVNMTFAKAFEQNDRHLPEKVSIIFGSAQPETLWVEGSQLKFDGTRQAATLQLEPAFSLGKTNGAYDGTLNGKEVVGAGQVVQHLGTGASYEQDVSLAEDRVGPVYVSGIVRNTSTMINLLLYASEPLVSSSEQTGILYQRERENQSILPFDVSKWATMQNNSVLNVIYSDTSSKAVLEGDRVRFAPLERSTFTDKSGNMPALNNPWVTVGSDGSAKIKIKSTMAEKVVAIDQLNSMPIQNCFSAEKCNTDIRVFIKNPTSGKLDFVKDGLVMGSLPDSSSLKGAVWKIEMNVPRGSGIDEPAAWNSLKISYDMPIYTNLGTFVNRLSDAFTINTSYLSNENRVTFFVEWASVNGQGLRSNRGRSVGTGAYIYKLDVKTKFFPNPGASEDVQKRFSGKSSYEKKETFGIKRTKKQQVLY